MNHRKNHNAHTPGFAELRSNAISPLGIPRGWIGSWAFCNVCYSEFVSADRTMQIIHLYSTAKGASHGTGCIPDRYGSLKYPRCHVT